MVKLWFNSGLTLDLIRLRYFQMRLRLYMECSDKLMGLSALKLLIRKRGSYLIPDGGKTKQSITWVVGPIQGIFEVFGLLLFHILFVSFIQATSSLSG